MKSINYKNILKRILVLTLVIAIQSCTRDEATEVSEFNRTEIMSYSDLFNSFWDTMNNNYNYFTAERDWDDVYNEYSPRFKDLKTFNDPNADINFAIQEMNLANKYFAEIIANKTIDRHFNVRISIPLPNGITFTNTFRGDMKFTYSEEGGYLAISTDKNPKISQSIVASNLKKDKLISNTIYDVSPITSGFLKDEPSTLYIQLKEFNINSSLLTEEDLKKLVKPKGNISVDQGLINDFKKVDPSFAQEISSEMDENIKEFNNTINSILTLESYNNYLKERQKFLQTEDVTNLKASITNMNPDLNIAFYKYYDQNEAITIKMEEYLDDSSNSEESKKRLNLVKRSYDKTIQTIEVESGQLQLRKISFLGQTYNVVSTFLEKMESIPDSTFDLYSKLFNPITNGTAKKVIIDLRGNGGGLVVDARNFTERFVTQQKVWGYQRTKEGNGRFNYSPWLEVRTKPNDFALKSNIPIGILIDNSSVSMSEISTLMIKSQGDHVKIVGDNSYGGFAGLGGNDDFNGGQRGSNNYIEFYMPLMAFKDANGKIVEAIGVTPDLKVIPTQEEIDNMSSTGVDPALNELLKILK